MTLSFLDYLTPADLPMPLDRPLALAEAVEHLGSPRAVRLAVRRGLLRSPVQGVVHAACLDDSLDLRLACLRLVVPSDAVACDRTAGWLHGAPRILAPGAHLEPPPADFYLPPGRRLRNKLAHSGERIFAPDELTVIGGVRVTTPARTACDLGRLLHRDQAIAALDSLLRTGAVRREEVLLHVPRFRGYRGVLQLRELAPLADGASQSPGESALRLRWIDCGDLPAPVLQWQVLTPMGPRFLDLARPELKYGAEYDGEEHHGEEHAEHDEVRRAWFREDGWTIDVFRRENVYGRQQDADLILRAGIRTARARLRGA